MQNNGFFNKILLKPDIFVKYKYNNNAYRIQVIKNAGDDNVIARIRKKSIP